MAQSLQLFPYPGSWDAGQCPCQGAQFPPDCQKKKKKRGQLERRKRKIAPGWDQTLGLFFSLISSVFAHQLSWLARTTQHCSPVLPQFPFSGCALGSSLLLNFMRTGLLWSPPPGKNGFFLFLFIYSFIFILNCVSITPCSPRREVDNLTLISSRLLFIHDTLLKGNGSPC